MGHLDYYSYQARARGVQTVADVCEIARQRSYLYDRIVLPWLPRDRSASIAELACGHGSFLAWLKEREYCDITGVDFSTEQIQLARQTGVATCEMDFKQWLRERSAASCGAIVAIDMIEHISKDEFMELLQGANRVLAPGGRLILRFPNGDSPLVGRNLFNDITHVWTYTTNCLETLGRMHGFAGFQFEDESAAAIRDGRWLKVPLCKLSTFLLDLLFRAVTKEKVRYWSPNIWACLEKR